MTSLRIWSSVAFVGAWFAIPDPLLAWGPGTHIALGNLVLGATHLLPPAIGLLLTRHPIHFLYGSVAADISLAKKYAPEGRHCHHWHVGEEIHDEADTDPLRAMALGYLAHLAADTVAHNYYVPRQLLFTRTTAGIGHTYWEHRMDVHVGEGHLLHARRIILEHDHRPADELMDRVLASTLFGFRTNRFFFRGMIRASADQRWIRLFDQILQRSRYDISDDDVGRYLALSFDAVIDYLRDRHDSAPAREDPIGEERLHLAASLRLDTSGARSRRDDARVRATADRFFPLPGGETRWWGERGDVRTSPSPDPRSE
ncbi:MAG: zinc dependent phospholipase C family protein [Longimicrobiales bacterium]|nr:zinc dependent phospholipase C family protein [Longimicrobiales bacterium]